MRGFFREQQNSEDTCVQVSLGIKMAQLGLKLLKMTDPQKRENLIVFVENNKCMVDAIQVTTGCSAGSRRLKMMNYGISAAAFIDKTSKTGYRIVEKKDLSVRAINLAVKDNIIVPDQKVAEFSKLEREIMMHAFAKLSAEELFDYYPIKVVENELLVPSKTEPRKICSSCGEEIRGGLAITQNNKIYCQSCCHGSYYQTLE